MRKMIVLAAMMLGMFALADDAPKRVPTNPSEIQAAMADHKLINGMTVKQANSAVRPVRPTCTRSGGRIVAAIWMVPVPSVKTTTQWSADVDPDMTIWNVQSKSVRQR